MQGWTERKANRIEVERARDKEARGHRGYGRERDAGMRNALANG